MSYTAGPWNYSNLNADGIVIKRDGTFEINTPHYDVCAYSPSCGPIRKEDDARLIAAAPELLEALKSIVHEIEIDEHVSNGMIAALDMAEAAVMKAEGK